MNAVAVVIKKLKAAITKLERQVAIGIRNARKYILELIDMESQLDAMQDQIKIVQVFDPTGSREFINEARIKDICVQDTDCDEYFKVIEGDDVFEIKLVSYFHFKSDAWVEKVPKHGKQQRVERPDLIQLVEVFKKELDKLPMW